MPTRSIQCLRRPIDASVRVPGSKSLSNRAVIAGALADGTSTISNFLLADDTYRLLDGIAKLGISFQIDGTDDRVEIQGRAGHLPETEADIDCGESGTMLRFFAALCATNVGDYRLHGHGRLHARPMGPLVAALRRMGALVEFEQDEDHAPLIIHGRGLHGGEVEVDCSMSSQFAGAILLSAPRAHGDVMLKITGTPSSRPYIAMTCSVMESFGVGCVTEDCSKIVVPAPQMFQAVSYAVEADASSASYFLAAVAICGGRVQIEGLGARSVQGDLAFTSVLNEMGCRTEIGPDAVVIERDEGMNKLRGGSWNLRAMPDVAPTLAVLALFADGPTTISGVEHLRYKESDRLAALAAQLGKLGAEVEKLGDGLIIRPPQRIAPCELDSFGDHRLAMALALVGLAVEGISIRDPECVSKSFPDYFERLSEL